MLTWEGLRLFVSSTSELIQERQAVKGVIKALHHTPYDYTDDRPRDTGPEGHLEHVIHECDGLVGIIGPNYGSEYSVGDALENRSKPVCRNRRITGSMNLFHHPKASCSLVEWKFYFAHYYGIEIMPFVKNLPDDSYANKQQTDFVHRLRGFRSEYTCKLYADTPELEAAVEKCILDFNAEHIDRYRARERALRNALLVTLFALLSVVTVLLGQANNIWTLSAILAPLYLLVTVALSAIILTLFRARRP